MKSGLLNDLVINEDTLPIISQFAENIPGGFFIYCARGAQELIYFNSSMVTLFGCESSDEFRALVNNSFKGIVHPDDYAAAEASIWEQINGSSNYIDHVKYRFVRKDGSVGMIDDYGHFSQSDTYGDIFYVFVQDVTQEYLVEQAVKQEAQSLIDGIASSYEVAYVVNLQDDSFKILHAIDSSISGGKKFDTFSEAIAFTISETTHPGDRAQLRRELDYDVIREKLNLTNSYDVDFRALLNGVGVWYTMNVTKVSDEQVAIGLRERDLEITKARLEEKRFEEYIALFVVDFDTQMIKPLKTSDWFASEVLHGAVPYESAMRGFARILEGDAQELFLQLADLERCGREWAVEDKWNFSFKSERIGGGAWIDVACFVILRHDDGTPAVFTLGFSPADTRSANRQEAQERLKEDMQMIGGLADEYHALYYLNMDKGLFEIYSLDETKFPEAYRIANAGGDPFVALRAFGTSPLVHPDDRALFEEFNRESFRAKLAHSKRFSLRFRRNFSGEYLWTEMDAIKYEDIDEPANVVAVGFAVRDADIRAEQTLNRCFSILGSETAPQKAIDELLFELGEFYGAARTYVFEIDGSRHTVSETYEWCRPGVSEFAERFQNLPLDVFDALSQALECRDALFMDKVDTSLFTPETTAFLEARGAMNLLIVPLVSGEDVVGFVGVDGLAKAEGNATVLKYISSVVYSEILQRREGDEEHITLRKLSDTFLSVYYVDLSRDYMHNWKIDDFGQDIYGGVGSYSTLMGGYVRDHVAERDRERCFEMTSPAYILKQFKTHDRFSVGMVDTMRGDERDYLFDFLKVSEEGNCFVMCCTDVTESVAKERERQQQLAEALSMAESANRAKTTFLNNMSHDIRTPMNAIIGYTGLAASHIDNKAQVQDYLGKIGQSSDHLLSLINDVLDMSRIESGKMNLDEKPESLPDIIRTLKDIVQADVRAKQHDFFIDTVNVHDELIVCDKLRLNQVLLNILSNAIKYTAAGGTISMRITEKTVKPSGYGTYEFRIKDNGMGMTPEFVKQIFDPFTRVKSSTVSGIQGTGLGMAITKNIVDMMGGKIEVSSELGSGTEITLTFDFMLQDGPRESVSIPELQGLRALVADDDANTAFSIYGMLKEVDMRAEWCASGKEAVFRAEASYQEGDLFKVYIIDWLMPDMNGVETTRRIRRAIGDDVPIIILTAYDWSDIEEEAREAGVTAFVSKPLFPSDLHAVLGACLGAVTEEVAAPVTLSYDFEGKRILLVEDNELNREIATEILEEEGFVVESAEDGDIAVDLLRIATADTYDLVLMDVQMPRMNGYEATRQIRALGTDVARIPILAMTANAFEEDRRAALDAGMDEHIPKPINVETLKDTLARFL